MPKAQRLGCHEHVDVLEGEVLVHLEGEEHRIGCGGVFIPPWGVAHAFMVTSDTVRLLVWQMPATGEAFYREVTEPIRSAEDISRPPDWARLRAAAERSPSIELFGPPPFTAAEEEAAAAPAQRATTTAEVAGRGANRELRRRSNAPALGPMSGRLRRPANR